MVEVILLSGHATLEASVGGMALGAFDYLLKPVRIDELVYKVEDAHHERPSRKTRSARCAGRRRRNRPRTKP